MKRGVALACALAGCALMFLPVYGLELPGGNAIPPIGVLLLLIGSGVAAFGVRAPNAVSDPRAWRRFRKNRGALGGAVLIVGVTLFSFVGPLLAPHDPDTIYDEGLNPDGTPVAPYESVEGELRWNTSFLLGADNMGRDELSRVLFGGRVSLAVALGAMLVAVAIGFVAGLLAGYFRGLFDDVVVQTINFVQSLPFLLVAIALNRVIDHPSLLTLCALLGVLSWTTLARVTRAKVMQVRELEYVQAARALGMGHARILIRHVVPNVLGPAIVIATTLVAQMIVVESAMSFLGLGVKPPTASWGSMLRDAQEYMDFAPRLIFVPGVLIVATVFGFNLLGEGMRDALDPKE